MKTRKALVVLKDGTSIEVTDIDDQDWTGFLILNTNWRAGKTGGVDLRNRGELVAAFEYEDITRVDLWPGSQEPWG